MSELKYWIWLSDLPLRPRTRSLLITHFGSALAAYFALPGDCEALGGLDRAEIEALKNKDLRRADQIVSRCGELGISAVTICDAIYPRRLARIYDPPALLYVRGHLPSMDDEAAIAIVGTRSATPYGMKMASRMGYGITKCGGLVVSGLTWGIDGEGARGALRAGGSCVGVLGTAIDAQLDALGRDVEAVGAIVSEYPPGAETHSSNFRWRNRITSGLSMGVVVVEAPEKSGALLFADEALEQGKEIYVVPANADADSGAGSNSLLKEGAKPVTDGWDVMCELQPLFPYRVHEPGKEALTIPQEQETGPLLPKPQRARRSKPEKGEDFEVLRAPATKKVIDNKNQLSYIDKMKLQEGLTEPQRQIVSAITGPDTQIDDIIDKTGLSAQAVLSELTLLQIKGLVSQSAGKRFTLNL